MAYYAQPSNQGWTVYRYLGLTKANYPTLAMAKQVADELGVRLVVLSKSGERMN